MAISKIELSLNSTAVKEYIKLHSMENDLYMCDEYLTILVRLKEQEQSSNYQNRFDTDKLIIQSITISFIITYMKLFMKGSRNTFQAGTIFHTPSKIEMHKLIYELRNQYIAHGVHFRGEDLRVDSTFKIGKDAMGENWSLKIEPRNKRYYSFLATELPLLKEMLVDCRAYWKSKSEEPTLKLAKECLLRHFKVLGNVIDIDTRTSIINEYEQRIF